MVLSLQGATYGVEQTLLEWYGNHAAYGLIGTPDFSSLKYISEVFRNSINLHAEAFYESGFIGLLNVHHIYIHSPNLGHYNSIGVRGESSTVKGYQFQTVFGYLILDPVVAQHGKIDVSRQLIKLFLKMCMETLSMYMGPIAASVWSL